jgi:hypothetical protein
VVAATVPLEAVDPEPVEPAPFGITPPPPDGNGYQATERLPNVEDELEPEDVVEALVVGDAPATGASSSGSVIGVSGFRRRIGSPVCGSSSESSKPWASFTRLERPWFQVAAPTGLRQLKP